MKHPDILPVIAFAFISGRRPRTGLNPLLGDVMLLLRASARSPYRSPCPPGTPPN
jgi:hypothetical protein